MTVGKRTFLSTIIYICIAGVIIFGAVFFGIRTGLAVRTSGVLGLTVENLTNNTQLVIGQKLPEITVYQENGPEQPLRDVCRGKNTVVAFLMPGCGPCGQLLSIWQATELENQSGGYQIILVAATSDNVYEIEEIKEGSEGFPLYLCDFPSLSMRTGIETFPTIFGIKGDGSIAFISSGFNKYLNGDFFSETFSN